MISEQIAIPALERCILARCPRAIEVTPDAITTFATHIFTSFQHAYLAASFADDEDALQELLKVVSRFQTILEGLGPSTKMELNYALPKSTHPSTESLKALAPLHETLVKYAQNSDSADLGRLRRIAKEQEALKAAVIEVLGRKAERKPFPTRRNVAGAVVAGACRKVWIRIGPKGTAPKELHHYRVSDPLAVFVKDVFDILRIGMAPASAFNSLKQLEKDGPLTLSVTHG